MREEQLMVRSIRQIIGLRQDAVDIMLKGRYNIGYVGKTDWWVCITSKKMFLVSIDETEFDLNI